MSIRHAERILLVLLSALAVACSNPVAPADVPFGERFDLRVGESARLGGRTVVMFVAVESDSRCPMDAMCVTAGEARLAVSVGESTVPEPPSGLVTSVSGAVIGSVSDGTSGIGCSGSSARMTCIISTAPDRSTVVARPYTIRLIGLAPYPSAASPPRRENYLATFVVDTR